MIKGIKSKVFPGTNRIPMDGGSITIKTDIFKTDLDDNFIPSYDPTLWTQYNTSGVYTTGVDKFFYVDFDATTSNFRWAVQYNHEFVLGKGFSFEFGQHLNLASGIPKSNVFSLMVGDGDDLIDILFHAGTVDPSQNEVEIFEYAGNQTFITPWSGSDFTGRVTVSDDYIATIYGKSPGEDYKVLANFQMNPTSGLPIVVSYRFDMWNGAGRTGRAYVKPFKILPRIEYSSIDHTKNYLISQSSNEATFKIAPPHPGDFNVRVYGAGSDIEVYETYEMSVIQERIKEDSTRFLVSPVKEFYDSNQADLKCADFGVASLSNRGEILVNQRCFCDGTARDGQEVKVEAISSGDVGDDTLDGNLPEFIYNDEGVTYGNNFEFSRQYVAATTATELSKNVNEMRTLVMSNGNKFYYGLGYTPLTSTIDFLPNFYKNNSECRWTLEKVDNVYELIDQSGDVNASSPTYKDPDYTYALEPGRYVFSFTHAEAEIELDGLGFAAVVDSSGHSSYDGEVIRVYFDVKEYSGHLVCGVHDICANSFNVYEETGDVVSLQTNSFAAVEIDEDNVMFMYQAPESSYINIQNAYKAIYYKIFNISTGTFSSDVPIQIPLESYEYVWAFDAASDGESLTVVYSRHSAGDYKDCEIFHSGPEFLLESPPLATQYPDISSRFNKIKIPLQDILGGGDVDYSNMEIESHVPMSLLKTTYPPTYGFTLPYELGEGIPVGNEIAYYNYPMAGLDYIRLSPDRGGGFVMAGLTYVHKVPFLWKIPRDGGIKEFAAMTHFNTFEIPNALSRWYPYENRSDSKPEYHEWEYSPSGYTGISSFSACVLSDGRVYTIATKDSYTSRSPGTVMDISKYMSEIGIIPSNIFKTPSHLPSGGAYYPRYIGCQYIPVFNNYLLLPYFPSTETRLKNLNISSDHGRLIVTAGCDSSKYPVIFQNGEPSEMPFHTTYESLLLPELLGLPPTGPASGLPGRARFLNDTHNALRLDISEDTSPFGKSYGSTGPDPSKLTQCHSRADIGYKFHFRVAVQSETVDLATLEGVAAWAKTLEPAGFAAYYQQTSARFAFISGSVQCQVLDKVTEDWETVQTFPHSDDLEDVKDYYIFIKQIDSTRSRVMFMIKSREYVKASATTGEAWSDYRERLEYVYGVDVLPLDNVDYYSWGSSSQFLGWYSTANGPGVIDLYQMGWNLLDQKDFAYIHRYESEDPTGMTAANIKYFEYGSIIATSPSPPQTFDDSAIFDQEIGKPSRGYAISISPELNSSYEYHWPNGILTSFSRGDIKKGDSWVVAREDVRRVDYMPTDRLHGMCELWDGAYLWADASDSDLEKFSSDTFLIEGSNARIVTVSGKNLITDPWDKITDIDLTRYSFTAGNFTTVKDTSTNLISIDINECGFNVGSLESDKFFLAQGDPDIQPYKVVKVVGRRITVQAASLHHLNQFTNNRDCKIFSSKGVVSLKSPVRYRYIGVTAGAYPGYEGGGDPYARFRAFDFGVMSTLPLKYNHSPNSGMELEMKSETNFVHDQQAFTSNLTSVKKVFNFEYLVTDAMSSAKMSSMISKVALNRKPVWVIESQASNPEKIYLCLMTDDPNSSVLVDEYGDKFYSYSLLFRSVR